MAHVATERRRPRVRTVNELPSMTVQSDLHRADMKEILRKYESQGVLVGMRNVDLAFRDVSEFTDFADMMRQGKEAEMAFMRLPSKVREAFGHDVGTWLDAAHDPEKLEKLRPQLEELGLLAKAPPDEVTAALDSEEALEAGRAKRKAAKPPAAS